MNGKRIDMWNVQHRQVSLRGSRSAAVAVGLGGSCGEWTLGNVIRDANQRVVGGVTPPISAVGCVAGEKCLPARVGAIVEVAAMRDRQQQVSACLVGSRSQGVAARKAARSVVGLVSVVALGLALMLGPQGAFAQGRDSLKFISPQAALDQGLGAYRGGMFGLAQQALGYAAERGSLLGQYYLARLYADPAGPFTTHAKAYELYRGIVEEHAARIDVDDDPRARYVGKSLTALAGYVLRGLPEIGLKPNPERAAGYLQEAATFFRDQDAQFELAKLFLTGEGVEVNHKQATSRLSTLAQAGHAGAQAFLADLYWRAKGGLSRDEGRALALITLAVENAPAHERIWIEDIYQSIFCGMAPGVRQQSEGLVASFRHRYAPRPGAEPQDSIGLAPRPVRTCSDGTPLPANPRESRADEPVAKSNTFAAPRPGVLQGGVMGIGSFDKR